MSIGVLFTVDACSDDRGMFLLELYRKALSLRENELYEFFLEHAVKVTKSKIGFFHFVSNNEKTIVLTSWNKQALKTCEATFETHYPIEAAGNWADSIRLRRPVIYNDFGNSPNQKGLPKGHVKVNRLLSFPLIEEGIVTAIYGVGNKKEMYTKKDIAQLNFVSNELKKILKQRRVEADLAASKEKYHLLFQNMMDGIAYCKMIYDSNGHPVDFVYLEVNEAFERLTGLKKDLVVGKKVSEAIPGTIEANPEIFDVYGRVTQTGVPERFELFFKPLGIWLDIAVYRPEKGFFVAVFENITERKKAQEALHESEHRWATTLSSIGDGVIATDVNGNVLFMNSEAEALTGWSFQDSVQKPVNKVFNIINEYTRCSVENPVKRVLESGVVVGLANHTVLVRKDGTEVPIDDSGAPISDEDGTTMGVVLVFHNISERRQAEEALRTSEQNYRHLLEYAPTAIYEIDYKGPRFKSVNDAMCRLTGYTREELLSMNPLDLLIPESQERFRDRIKAVLSGRTIDESVEFRTIRKDGKKLDVVLYVKPTYKEGKLDSALVVGYDVTDRKELQDKLHEYATRMEKLAEERALKLKDAERLAAIGATAGMVGHDIRNPLQAIVGDIFLVKSDLSVVPESKEKEGIMESLEGIEDNIEYINKIVQDLQDYARPLAPAVKETHLDKLCEEVTMVKKGIPENIEACCTVEEDVKKIVADPVLLKRVLANLVNNAIQAMPQGGNLDVHAFREAGDVVITVQDTGEGIPEEVRPKLFTPLFTTKSKGQGFGLAVVKRITETLGGTVTFESRIGNGTTFIVRLPLQKNNK